MKDDKENIINRILDEIFTQKVSSIPETRRADLYSFMRMVVNGDMLDIVYLVIPARVTKEEDGILAYVISETRLLKFDITSKEVSSSFKLDDISSITYSREKEKRSIKVSTKDSERFWFTV